MEETEAQKKQAKLAYLRDITELRTQLTKSLDDLHKRETKQKVEQDREIEEEIAKEFFLLNLNEVKNPLQHEVVDKKRLLKAFLGDTEDWPWEQRFHEL